MNQETHSSTSSNQDIQPFLKNLNEQFLKENEYLKKNINNHSLTDVLKMFCNNKEDHLIVNMGLLRYVMHLDIGMIIGYIESHVKELNARGHETTYIHVSLKNLTIGQIDTNMQLVKETANFFCYKYPKLLNRCYIHHSNTLITYVFKLMASFFSKETMAKIVCYTPEQSK